MSPKYREGGVSAPTFFEDDKIDLRFQVCLGFLDIFFLESLTQRVENFGRRDLLPDLDADGKTVLKYRNRIRRW
jgi:hypothetical protein